MTSSGEPLHVSQLDSQQLLRLSRWFAAKGEDMVPELMKTAGSLTPEQEAVANREARFYCRHCGYEAIDGMDATTCTPPRLQHEWYMRPREGTDD